MVTVSVIATLSPDAESVAVEDSSVWNSTPPVFAVVTVVLTKCWKIPIFAIVCGSVSDPFAVNVFASVYVAVPVVCAHDASRGEAAAGEPQLRDGRPVVREEVVGRREHARRDR
jgi:hypothetical protein